MKTTLTLFVLLNLFTMGGCNISGAFYESHVKAGIGNIRPELPNTKTTSTTNPNGTKTDSIVTGNIEGNQHPPKTNSGVQKTSENIGSASLLN